MISNCNLKYIKLVGLSIETRRQVKFKLYCSICRIKFSNQLKVKCRFKYFKLEHYTLDNVLKT